MTAASQAHLAGRPLQEILAAQAGISAEDWAAAAEQNPGSPELALVEMGLLGPVALAQAKAARWGLPFIELNGSHPSRDALAQFSTELLSTGLVLPIELTPTTLTVAIADPDQWQLRDQLLREAGSRTLQLVVAAAPEIRARVVTADDEAAPDDPAGSEEETRALLEAPPVVRLVDHLISSAISQGSSDIHVGHWGAGWEARYRIDGHLQHAMPISRRLYRGVISRLKVLAKLDIAEHRLPQDGEIPWPSGQQRRWDLRLATLPAKRAEHAVIRIFGHTPGTQLSELGFSGPLLDTLDRLCRVPNGIVLATGPTGGGKTTTLATMLRRIQQLRHEDSIYSAEDPVEMQIPGVVQIQVMPKAGLTFATVLRTLLRSDPDVLFVGEIRDAETARIAVQAALTGHLVLSTLHTNDAPGAVTRLIDMGIEPYLVAEVLRGVIAQRLARRVCERCGTFVELSGDESVLAPGLVVRRERRGVGCAACHAGYRGRLAVAEVLVVTPPVGELIAAHAPAQRLRDASRMRALLEDGQDKVVAGLTTVHEVRRLATVALEADEPVRTPEVAADVSA